MFHNLGQDFDSLAAVVRGLQVQELGQEDLGFFNQGLSEGFEGRNVSWKSENVAKERKAIKPTVARGEIWLSIWLPVGNALKHLQVCFTDCLIQVNILDFLLAIIEAQFIPVVRFYSFTYKILSILANEQNMIQCWLKVI